MEETWKKELIADLKQTGVAHLLAWAKELEDGKDLSPALKKWLKNLSDYYTEKNRPYGNWLSKLAE